MPGFGGFPPGKTEMIGIPALFFSELLPQIDHLAELQITLYCFWALHAQEGNFRYITLAEATTDERLGLTADVIQDALERAVARGTLLHVQVQFPNRNEELYFMNTVKGRKAVEAVQAGDWVPDAGQRPIKLALTRPNVFTLYEQNIGPLTPLIADELRDAEATYSAYQVEQAIKIAVEKNIRNLRYIMGILKNEARGD